MYFGGQLNKISSYVKYGDANYNECSSSSSSSSSSSNSSNDNNDNNNNISKDVNNNDDNNDFNESESMIRAKKFKFIVGCCTWDEGMLAKELAAGFWITAISQPDLLIEKSFNSMIKNINNCDVNNNSSGDRDNLLHDIDDIVNERNEKEENDIWNFLLKKLGGPFPG
jgi:hypothetical protein